jgi:hypothetical protein
MIARREHGESAADVERTRARPRHKREQPVVIVDVAIPAVGLCAL